jgi:3-oxoacyl-[acyl-carrier protein] reductase
MNLTNKRILITGGSSGIGFATAKLLASKGAKVLITGRREETLVAAAKEMNAAYAVADISTPAGVQATVDAVHAQLGGLDVLINNAAIGEFGPVESLTWEALERVYSINVFGTAMLTAALVPGFKAQASGTIINIASTAGVKGFANGSIYSGTKFALRSMTQCWQDELRRSNIRVCLINPSEVTTAFNQTSREERPEVANKLRGQEIAHAITGVLEMDDRGFVPELTVFATNPW